MLLHNVYLVQELNQLEQAVVANVIEFDTYEKLIKKTAWKCFKRLDANGVVIDFEDVYQELVVTFCMAKDGFDASKGYKFSTYLVTSMYRQFNRFAEPLIQGRSLISSVEELEAFSAGDDGDAPSMYELVDSNEPTPEDIYASKKDRMATLRGLSNDTKRVVRSLIDPSDLLLEAYEAKKAQVNHGIELGIKTMQINEDITFGFILEQQPISRAAKLGVRTEIKSKFGIKI